MYKDIFSIENWSKKFSQNEAVADQVAAQVDAELNALVQEANNRREQNNR